MSSEIRAFSATVPINTPPANPQITPMIMPPRIVRAVDIVVPSGPNGFLGFAIGMAGQPIIPFGAGQWIITAGEVVHYDLDGYLDSGAWQLFAYNLGIYPHTLQVRFAVDLVDSQQGSAGMALISPDALSSS